MALIKAVETPQGLVGTYHKISKVEIFPHNETVVVSVNMYASEEARHEGKSFFWQEPVVIPFSAFNQNPLDILYPLIANYMGSPFADATADIPVPAVPNFEIKLNEKSRMKKGDIVRGEVGHASPATIEEEIATQPETQPEPPKKEKE